MTVSRATLVFLGRLALFLAIIFAVELGVASGALNKIFFASPSDIATMFLTQIEGGTLLRDAWITFAETMLGLACGGLLGMILGLVMPQMRTISAVIEPFMMTLNGIPVIVLAPLFVLWLGIGLWSKIGISVYIVFFTMFLPVYTGSIRLERELVDALHVMGASKSQIFWKVVVPSSRPSIYTGLKLGAGFALVGAVIGEFVSSRAGLGHMILYAGGTLDTPSLYLGIIILALFSVALSSAVDALGPVLVRWRFFDEK
jgi:NitT/TauT family transport system permease protein